jgi:putative transposase
VPVGLWEGSTENKTVATHLLSDLVSRGLDAEDGLLVVIDGAKALSAAVTAVFGANAAIQRCTVHKRRNVADHLPEDQRDWVDAKLVRALANPDAAAGLRDATALATALDRTHPGAAASLREGLDELFTVARLGITGTLAKTLTSSNPIESMISIARTTNRNVTRWRDGQMVLRWDRRRHAQRPALIPPGQGPQAAAPTRRRTAPTRPPNPRAPTRNCRHRRLTSNGIVTEVPRTP